MMKINSTSIVSVSKVEDQHPDFCFLLKNEKLKNYAKRNFKVKRRQDIEDIFFLEGSVYASFIDSFLKEKSFCQSDTAAYIVPKWKSFEIDDIWDFINIEAIMKFNKKSKNAKKK